MKILIGYDGSECSDAALEDLRRAGVPEESEAVILTVADVREMSMLPFFADSVPVGAEQIAPTSGETVSASLNAQIEQARDLAAQAVEKIKGTFPEWNITAETAHGKPADELINKADEIAPDLLVVGSHGRSAIGRAVLGSVSQKILHEARCSVRIARSSSAEKNAGLRLLIAVDGSANAEAAVASIAGRSWREDTEIRLIAVDDPFTHPEAGYIRWDLVGNKPIDSEESREWIEKVIGVPAKKLESAGLNVAHRIRWGDAANIILNEAEDWNADTIFLGARGLGRLKRFLLGSVSSSVAARAHCTVEVVRHFESDD